MTLGLQSPRSTTHPNMNTIIDRIVPWTNCGIFFIIFYSCCNQGHVVEKKKKHYWETTSHYRTSMSYKRHLIFTSVSTIKKPHTHTQKCPSTWEKSSEASGQELQCDRSGWTAVGQTDRSSSGGGRGVTGGGVGTQSYAPVTTPPFFTSQSQRLESWENKAGKCSSIHLLSTTLPHGYFTQFMRHIAQKREKERENRRWNHMQVLIQILYWLEQWIGP